MTTITLPTITATITTTFITTVRQKGIVSAGVTSVTITTTPTNIQEGVGPLQHVIEILGAVIIWIVTIIIARFYYKGKIETQQRIINGNINRGNSLI
jgi:hypothetical protein